MALNGKRMQTFFNEFLVTTTSFLNQFASDCENKFIAFERKLNKIESNLLIVEQKLASVPLTEDKVPDLPDVETLKPAEPPKDRTNPQVSAPAPASEPSQAPPEVVQQEEPPVDSNQIKISNSTLYKKYFTMLKVGVPIPAVKQKMSSKGLDCRLLDNPDRLIDKSPEDDEEQ